MLHRVFRHTGAKLKCASQQSGLLVKGGTMSSCDVGSQRSGLHLYEENVLQTGKGMKEVVLALPEDLAQVLVVHGPGLEDALQSLCKICAT